MKRTLIAAGLCLGLASGAYANPEETSTSSTSSHSRSSSHSSSHSYSSSRSSSHGDHRQEQEQPQEDRSFEEQQEICRGLIADEQRLDNFPVSVNCKYKEVFWAPHATQSKCVGCSSSIKVRVTAKSNSMWTDWEKVPYGEATSETINCLTQRKWKMTYNLNHPSSCKEILEYKSEQQICEEKLNDIITSCHDQLHHELSKGEIPFSPPKGSLCKYKGTDKISLCFEDEDVDSPKCDRSVPTQGPEQSVPSVPDEPTIDPKVDNALGSHAKAVRFKRVRPWYWFDLKCNIVKLMTDDEHILPDRLLDRLRKALNLRVGKGWKIYEINGEIMSTVSKFTNRLQKYAKSHKKVYIKLVDPQGDRYEKYFTL